MAEDEEANERSRLLDPRVAELSGKQSRRGSAVREDATSIISSHVSKDERDLGDTAVGERLPYNDYTTIDWLHDLVCLYICGQTRADMSRRSRTPSGIELSRPTRVSKAVS